MLLAHSLSSPRLLRRFTWLIVVAMGYIAARGWIDYASGTNLLQGERLQGAVPGLMGNPNDLAMNMVTFLPFAAFAALTPGKTLARLFAAGVTRADARRDPVRQVARRLPGAGGDRPAHRRPGRPAAAGPHRGPPGRRPRPAAAHAAVVLDARLQHRQRRGRRDRLARAPASPCCRTAGTRSSNIRSRASAPASSRTTTRPIARNCGARRTTSSSRCSPSSASSASASSCGCWSRAATTLFQTWNAAAPAPAQGRRGARRCRLRAARAGVDARPRRGLRRRVRRLAGVGAVRIDRLLLDALLRRRAGRGRARDRASGAWRGHAAGSCAEAPPHDQTDEQAARGDRRADARDSGRPFGAGGGAARRVAA